MPAGQCQHITDHKVFSSPLYILERKLLYSMFRTCIKQGLLKLYKIIICLIARVFRIYGPERTQFVESLVASDIDELPNYKAILSRFLNEEEKYPGILDDCLVQKFPDHIWIVNNAINACKIANLIKEKQVKNVQNISANFSLEQNQLEHCLLSVQGPRSEEALQRLIQDQEHIICGLKLGQGSPISIYKENCYISRTGYTGEDGFEVLCSKSSQPIILLSFLDLNTDTPRRT